MRRSRWSRRLAALAGTALLALVSSLAGAQSRPAREARVVATLAPGAGVPSVAARVIAVTANGEERSSPLRVPGEIRLSVSDPPAKVRLEAPGFWSRSAPLQPGDVKLRLHPLARIGGTVVVPGRGGPPASLRLLLEGAPLEGLEVREPGPHHGAARAHEAGSAAGPALSGARPVGEALAAAGPRPDGAEHAGGPVAELRRAGLRRVPGPARGHVHARGRGPGKRPPVREPRSGGPRVR